MNLRFTFTLLAILLGFVKGISQTSLEAENQIAIVVSGKDTSYVYLYMQPYVAGEKYSNTNMVDKGLGKYRYTFDAKTPVYDSPLSGGEAIDTIVPFMPVILESEGIEPWTDIRWYKVWYNGAADFNGNQNVTGYIMDGNLDVGNVSQNFILGKSPYNDTFNEDNSPGFKLVYVPDEYKYSSLSSDNNHILSLELSLGGIDNYNHFYLEEVQTSLKGNPTIIRLYWHSGESCPESEGTVIIVKTKQELKELIKSELTGDGGFLEYKKVYIPMEFANKKISLVENADIHSMLNQWDQSLNIYTDPLPTEIPITECVVVIEGEESEYIPEELEDSNSVDNNETDTEASSGFEITRKVVKYYQWNGKNLDLKKEEVIVDKNAESEDTSDDLE